MNREQEAAFIIPLIIRFGFAYAVRGPLVEKEPIGQLVLFENGIPLGPGNSLHDLIRRTGNGAYSYWGHTLYFSSLDGSDPRTNGRAYTYRAQAGLKPIIEILGALAALSAALCFSLARASIRGSYTASPPAAQSRYLAALGLAMVAAGAVSLPYLLAFPWLQRPAMIVLQNDKLTHGTGYAYYTKLQSGKRWPWRQRFELASLFLPNQAELLEDGASIGRISAEPRHVAREGAGGFAWFDDALVLSSSDGTDPRTNGRRYELKTSVAAVPSALFSAAALLIFGAVILQYRRLKPLALIVSHFGPMTRGIAGSALADCVVVTLAVLSAAATVLLLWWAGHSGHLGVAGYFPVSDALGYFRCAVAIGASNTLDAGSLSADWCSRRVLYPVMLSSLLGMSGWRPSVVLILQAGMIGAAAGAFILALQRSLGWLAAFVAGFGLFVAAREFALGNFMTESISLTAALAGLALLFLSLRTWPHGWLSLTTGLALISVGMAIRAGALLALLTLALWLVLVSYRLPSRQRWLLWLMGAIALAFGILLQVAVLYRFGIDPSNTVGNAATSLYGLSTGSRDWTQGYRDFAQSFRGSSETLAFKEIQAAALANIRTNPEVFLRSLLAAGAYFLRGMFRIGMMTEFNGILTALFWLGVLVCISYRRHLPFGLLLAILAGEILSASFVYDSGGHRVFTVTLPARLAVVGLACAFVVSTRSRFASLDEAERQAAHQMDKWPRRLAGFVAILIIALAVIPETPLASPFRLLAVPKAGICDPDEREIVVRLGRESMQLAFAERAFPVGDERLAVLYESLQQDPAARGSWWLAELKPQPRGTTLLYAIQRSSEDLGAFYTAYARHPIPGHTGAFVSLCVTSDTSGPHLGDFGFLRIVRSRLRVDL